MSNVLNQEIKSISEQPISGQAASVQVDANCGTQAKLSGKTIVIKYGGNVLSSNEAKALVAQDMALLLQTGANIVIVHGGGAEISQALLAEGHVTTFIQGLRVTDAKVLGTVDKVLTETNQKLVTVLKSYGIKAVRVHGAKDKVFKSAKQAAMADNAELVDLGFVGNVQFVNKEHIYQIFDAGCLPVIVPMGFDESNQSYNINADQAAMSLALALGADKLLFVSDVPGVMSNASDPKSLIPSLTVDTAAELISKGIVSGGMIPKLQGCIHAINSGVQAVQIISGLLPNAVTLALTSSSLNDIGPSASSAIGTTITGAVKTVLPAAEIL